MGETQDSEQLDLLRTELGAQFEIIRLIGKGGMGAVFLARELSLDRLVALKVLPSELIDSASSRERFRREARMAARLNHPSIVPLFSYGETGSLLYYVMGYVDGESLQYRIDRLGTLPGDELLTLLRSLCEALGHAHRKGVIHRDIKPSNIMIDGESGRVLLTDFGIGRASGAVSDEHHGDSVEEGTGLTQTGAVLGSPTYMAPEQATGSEVDARTDIYSLAVTVYEAATGEVPFAGPSIEVLLAKKLDGGFPPLSEARPDLERGFAKTVDTCLQPKPSHRPDTTERVLALMQGFDRRASDWTGAFSSLHNRLGLKGRLVSGLVLGVLFVGGYLVTASNREAPLDPSPANILDSKRIAVLVFDGVSSEEDLSYLSDGFAETLISAFSRDSTLDVVPISGARAHGGGDIPLQAVAAVLGAGTVVRGTIGADEEFLDLTLQVFDGNSGARTQRGALSATTRDLIVARNRLTALAGQLLSDHLGETVDTRPPGFAGAPEDTGPQTSDSWVEYWKGKEQQRLGEALLKGGDQDGFSSATDRAESHFLAAHSEDPDWTQPVNSLGWLAYRRSRAAARTEEGFQHFEEGMRRAEEVLGLDPENADALNLRGTLQYTQWFLSNERELLSSAQADLERAVQIDPALSSAWSTLSHLYYQNSDLSYALTAARRAVESDPYLPASGDALWRLWGVNYDIGQLSEAQAICEEGVERYPDHPRFIECRLWTMAQPDAGTPDVGNAWELLDSLVSFTPSPQREHQGLRGRIIVAGVLAHAELPDSAERVLDMVHSQTTDETDPGHELPFLEARVRTMLGDFDTAVALLATYFGPVTGGGSGSRDTEWANHWWWRDLRGHAGFQELLRR